MFHRWGTVLSAATPLLLSIVLMDQVAVVSSIPPEPSAGPAPGGDWSGANFFGYGSCTNCWNGFGYWYRYQTKLYCDNGGLPDRCKAFKIISDTIIDECECR